VNCVTLPIRHAQARRIAPRGFAIHNKNPATRGGVLSESRRGLVRFAATREAESGQADAEQSECGRLGHGGRGAEQHKADVGIPAKTINVAVIVAINSFEECWCEMGL
jgi:hypothetical protein